MAPLIKCPKSHEHRQENKPQTGSGHTHTDGQSHDQPFSAISGLSLSTWNGRRHGQLHTRESKRNKRNRKDTTRKISNEYVRPDNTCNGQKASSWNKSKILPKKWRHSMHSHTHTHARKPARNPVAWLFKYAKEMRRQKKSHKMDKVVFFSSVFSFIRTAIVFYEHTLKWLIKKNGGATRNQKTHRFRIERILPFNINRKVTQPSWLSVRLISGQHISVANRKWQSGLKFRKNKNLDHFVN